MTWSKGQRLMAFQWQPIAVIDEEMDWINDLCQWFLNLDA
jgi:hypothetical protein